VKLLKRRGLILEMLHNVFYAIIVSKLVYGISSLLGTVFLVKAQITQINGLFKRAFTYGYVKPTITVEELVGSYDHISHIASRENHCFHHLLPVAKSTCYALRQVGHGLSIEHILSELHKKTLSNRMIFSNCYKLCFFMYPL